MDVKRSNWDEKKAKAAMLADKGLAMRNTFTRRRDFSSALRDTAISDNTSFSTRRRLAGHILRPRNPKFAHGEELLLKIHDSLQYGVERVRAGETQCVAVALVGLVSRGTELALEYCYRHLEDYEVILWFRAGTAHTLLADIQMAARILGLLDDVRSATSPEDAWDGLLQQASSSWLLVLDDADDTDPSLYPWTTEACILLISRHTSWTANVQRLIRNPMSQEETDDKVFTKLFASDPRFASSASAFLEFNGRELFEQKCRDLISKLSIDLQDEQTASARVFQELEVFAQDITKSAIAFGKVVENVDSDTNKHSQRYLDAGIIEINLSTPTTKVVSSAESGSEDIEQNRKSERDSTVSIDFMSFVLESKALQEFKRKFTQLQYYQSVAEEYKKPLEILEEESSSVHISPPLPPQRQSKTVTVTWNCRCGITITDQYTEFKKGAVRTYFEERTLNHNRDTDPQDNSSRTRGWFGSIRGMLNAISKQLINPFVRRQKQSQSGTNNPAVQEDSIELPPVPNSNIRPKHLQLCISRHRRYTHTSYTSQSLNLQSDKILYDLLRVHYTKLTGRWRRLFLLRHISRIRFVKFRLRTNKLVTIEAHSEMEARIRECLPPENDDNYGFAPPEPDFLPPIGHNEMVHYFYNPCIGKNDDLHIRRFPGHKLNPVPFQPTEEEKHVWGIELLESENRKWLYLSIPIFTILISSMAFGLCWAVIHHDIQGGFTVAGYIVASGLALLGSIQVFVEDVWIN